MKIIQNKLLIFLLLTFSSLLFSSSVEINGYKLEIKENSGRFVFSMKNEEGKYISVFSDEDSRTSSFNIFEDNGFYTLGETFRYKSHFEETSDGGIFLWTSKNLLIKQMLSLDSEGFLSIDFTIMNISKETKSIGIKYLIDTSFEQEDHFYLKQKNGSHEIESEFEVEDTNNLDFWTSGVRNSKGASLMMIPTENIPSRIIFGNWDLLDNSDYYYHTASGRDFNNPPYSINDSAVVYFYSPNDVLSQERLHLSLCLRAIKTVENFNEIVFKEKSIVSNPSSKVVNFYVENETILKPEPLLVIETIEEERPEVLKKQEVLEDVPIPTSGSEEKIDSQEQEFVLPPKVDQIMVQQIDTLSEIQKIIETLSKPGIIDQNYLSELEDLINKLEEINIDEN